MSDAYSELPPISSDLREHEPTGQIAKWWWRQALRIIAGRGAEINDGLPRSWEWDSIAEMTGARFNHWLEGLFDPDAFGAYHDALWDREYLSRRKKLTPPE